jgi:hypothetical protein
VSTRMPTRMDGERRFVLRRARTGTRRPRTRDAIRAAQAPILRIESSMLPPTVTRHHRWMETMFEKACKAGTLRDAMKRPAATFDQSRLGAPNSPGRPRPKTGRDRKSPHQSPKLGHRSETRLLRTLSKCSEMLPPPGCPRPGSHASSSGTQNYSRCWRPLSHLRHRSPKETGTTPTGHLAATLRRPNQRALQRSERTTERAAHGRPQPTLPSIAASTKRDRRRSEAHHHEPNLSTSVQDRGLELRETGGLRKPAEIASRAPSNARD